MKKIQNIYKILFFTFPFIVGALVLLTCYVPPYTLSSLSYKGKELQKSKYTDKSSGGNSACVILNNSQNALVYRYRRGNTIKFPYSGVNVLSIDSTLIDISMYSHVVFTMKADKGQRIPFYFTTFINNYSHWNVPNTFIQAQYILDVDDTFSDVILKLSDYKIPNWWYGINDKSVKDYKNVDFSKVGFMNFQDCNLVKYGGTDTVYIKKIIFYKSLYYYVWATVIFILLYFGVSFLIIESRKKNKKLKELIAKNPTKISTKIEKEKEEDKEKHAVFKYIENNYSNPDLSIVEVEKRTGVAERVISQIIKSTTDLNFKQFLNYLRITEAKQLLTETDMRISEIAFKTGYNNVSHFNRVFKSMVNTFPSDFRESSRNE